MMKKFLRNMALMLVMVLVLSSTAFAAGTDQNPAVTPGDSNTTAAFDSTYTKIDLTYNNSAIKKDGLYMVFVVKANDSGAYVPTESSILYINQGQATADGSISFSGIYPSDIEDSAIMISGTGLSEPVVVAAISVPYTLGDVNEDDEVDTKDLTRLARYIAGATSEINLAAADTNADGDVDTKDLTRLARYLAGAATLG